MCAAGGGRQAGDVGVKGIPWNGKPQVLYEYNLRERQCKLYACITTSLTTHYALSHTLVCVILRPSVSLLKGKIYYTHCAMGAGIQLRQHIPDKYTSSYCQPSHNWHLTAPCFEMLIYIGRTRHRVFTVYIPMI